MPAVFSKTDILPRIPTLVAFTVALALGGLGDAAAMGNRALGALVGVAFALGLAWLWGPRTEPKGNFWWWVLSVAAVAWAFAAGFGAVAPAQVGLLVLAPLALLVALYAAHDHHLAPSVLLGASVLAALVQPGVEWRAAADPEAWWIAFATVAGVAAAVLERERLLARDAAATPWPWTAIRLGFAGVWTLVLLSFRESIQWGQFFAWVGLDPRGDEGQLLLVAILLVGLVVAVLALKPRRAKPQAPGGPADPSANP